MSCPNDFYSTEFNRQYQTLYSQKAQAVNTDLSQVVTSGWSLDRILPKQPIPVQEGYMKTPSGGYQNISSTKYVVPTDNGNKVISEGYGCSTPTVVASPTPTSSTEYYKPKGNTLMAAPLLPGALVEGYSSCPTNYLNTDFNKAYQKLYSTTC